MFYTLLKARHQKNLENAAYKLAEHFSRLGSRKYGKMKHTVSLNLFIHAMQPSNSWDLQISEHMVINGYYAMYIVSNWFYHGGTLLKAGQ